MFKVRCRGIALLGNFTDDWLVVVFVDSWRGVVRDGLPPAPRVWGTYPRRYLVVKGRNVAERTLKYLTLFQGPSCTWKGRGNITFSV